MTYECHARVKLRLAAGCSFFLIGHRKAIFSEREQKVFELNDAAAYIGCRLGEQPSFHDLVLDLSGRGFDPDVAADYVGQLLLAWSQRHLVNAELSTEYCKAPYVQRLRIGHYSTTVRYRDPQLAQLVMPPFEHLDGGSQDHDAGYDVAAMRGLVFIGKGVQGASVFTRQQAAPALKGLLTEDILTQAGSRIVLHAAYLVKDGRGLLLSGAPGAGKTTLTLALTEAGLHYGGDDISLFHPNGMVQGIPFALALKSGAWALAGKFRPDTRSLPIHRRLDGKRVRYVTPTNLAKSEPAPLQWIIVLRRRPAGPAVIKPIDPAQALAELVRGAFSRTRALTGEALGVLIRTISKAHCCELTYADASDAAKAVDDFCARR